MMFLKGEIKNKIKSALKLNGSNIDVKDSGCPDGFIGNDQYNIVNRLGINGIQIGQPLEACKQYYTFIA